MKLMTKEIREQLPPLYAQEQIEDPIAYLKFFTPDTGWTWYVTEGVADDAHDDYEFFGYVIGLYKEWGYFTLHELKTVRGALGLPVERDLSFEPTPMSKLI